MKSIHILGIETSCDETAAAVIESGISNQESRSFLPKILSSIVASQIDLHQLTGGVVPEVAARAHVEKILPMIEQALKPISELAISRLEKKKTTNSLIANLLMQSIDAIAVTYGPGLIGSLLIGVETAKALAYSSNKPIIPINHLEGHIYANLVGENPSSKFQIPNKRQKSNFRFAIRFPALILIVSGGHTLLVLMKDRGRYQTVGETRDDAAGECFDKCARLLGLPYPGGPALSQFAEQGDSKAFDLPRPMIDSNNFDFSFSGLKTAVYYKIRKLAISQLGMSNPLISKISPRGRPNLLIANLAASIQQAIVDVLVAKTVTAAKEYQAKTVMIAGGVAANALLRSQMERVVHRKLPDLDYRQPNLRLATDNAAMIAIAGAFHYLRGDFKNWYDVNVDPKAHLS